MNPKILASIVVFVLLAGAIGTPIMQSVYAVTHNEAADAKKAAEKKAAEKKAAEKKAEENNTSIKPTPKQTGDFTQALNGKYHGTAEWTSSFEGYHYTNRGGFYPEVCKYSGSITLQLYRDGDHVAGNADLTNYQLTNWVERSVCDAIPIIFGGAISTTIFGSGFSGTVGELGVDGQFTSDLLRGQLNGATGVVVVKGDFTANRVN